MYSLNCDYFVEEFSSIEKLLYYVEQVGMDPNYEITRNGKCTGELLVNLIGYWLSKLKNFFMMFLLILGIVMLLVYGNESQQRGSTTEINED